MKRNIELALKHLSKFGVKSLKKFMDSTIAIHIDKIAKDKTHLIRPTHLVLSERNFVIKMKNSTFEVELDFKGDSLEVWRGFKSGETCRIVWLKYDYHEGWFLRFHALSAGRADDFHEELQVKILTT